MKREFLKKASHCQTPGCFRFRPFLSHAAAFLILLGGIPVQAAPLPTDSELLQLSLEDLMTLEVTSASRKSQSLANTAAAVFVITHDDIRRSGVTNIPDALRMVPGVTVARIDSSKWAVTARGFNGRFARKLLVLIDGRSAYSPLFSGVFWDAQDTLLEDIEQIEVIRGPGATIWGANAVNGVINIITKKAEDTTGGLLVAGAGNYERGFGSVRYGTELGEWGALRVYGKYFNRNELKAEDGRPADDGWDMGRGGFRMDGKSGQNSFTLQGDFYNGTERERIVFPDLASLATGYMAARTANTTVNGGNILSRWTRSLDDDGELSLQLYYDRNKRDIPQLFNDTTDTVDLDLLHRFQWGGMHETVWGGGFRFIDERIVGSDTLSFNPAYRNEKLYSAFLQDDITVAHDKLHLIIGSKFEHNVYTGFEVQPSGRLIWTPNERLSLWSAVSRAVHTPSRGESDNMLKQFAFPYQANPADPNSILPMVVAVQGPGNLQAEVLMAYEAGLRIKASDSFTVDLAGFYNNYQRLIGVTTPLLPQPGPGVPPSYYLLTNTLNNADKGETWGGEMAADWQAAEPWRLVLAYSYIDASEMAGERPPSHQVSLRSQLELAKNVELDLWGRYVGASEDYLQNTLAGYLNLDARLGWRPVKMLELSLVGRNLLHQRQQEYRPEFIQTLPSGTGREVYGKVSWDF
ncbi:MAG: TonB-dependent receptor plug domain-containing protein [Desulfuromonadaceae bacterium]